MSPIVVGLLAKALAERDRGGPVEIESQWEAVIEFLEAFRALRPEDYPEP